MTRRAPHRQPRGPRATVPRATAAPVPCGNAHDHRYGMCSCWHQYGDCPCWLPEHQPAHLAAGCACAW